MNADAIHLTKNPDRRIGLPLKVAYSAFVLSHLWVNLRYYGPLNYLWFCDMGMVAACIGLWFENRLLLSMVTLSILGPAGLWSVDLAWRILTGHYLLGMAGYMTYHGLPLSIRAASTFHLWLPLVMFWCLWRLGYDRRAIIYQTLFAITLLIVSRIVSAPPPGENESDIVNINFVYGHSDILPPNPPPAWLYISKMVIKYWVFMYLPLHVFLLMVFDRRNNKPAGNVSPPDSTAKQPTLA